jgi:hypothetical protein
MKRFEITITCAAPDDLFDQGAVLSAAKPALAELVTVLTEQCGKVDYSTKVLPQRKAKIVPGNPGAPPDAGKPLADMVIAGPEQPHRSARVARGVHEADAAD